VTQEQALSFIVALNKTQEFVPPVLFNQVIRSPVADIIASIANGRSVVEIKPLPEPPSPA
jgi:hypothetical protein